MATRILYVEDETFLAKIVKESLESRGFEVQWHEDGKDVLNSVEEFEPDICVLDIMLPHKDGLTLAEEIRSSEHALPIIFLTAKSQTEDIVKGFSVGGNDYLKKPFSMEELIVRIENLLNITGRTNTNGGNDVFTLGAFTFDSLRMTLSYHGEKRRLSHREAELLKHLAKHQNIPIDRKDILLKFWGDDNIFNSRNLDVYITRLRKYLKPDPTLQIITLKGVGYQFVTA